MREREKMEAETIGTSNLVTCLGTTYENENLRKIHFSNALRKKLETPGFQKAEGFPDGCNEDIIGISNPPYYTCCPNPWIEEFVRLYGNTKQSESILKPFSENMKPDKNHPVYSFHPYHTKVPPEIIEKLIKHYSNPGDIVLDVFCGTGMTGVAAKECGRNVILNDLSPVASFIAGVNVTSVDAVTVAKEIERIIGESSKDWGWVYQTIENGKEKAVDYYVWSDVFTCPRCSGEFPFFPHGVIHHGNKVETRKNFPCPFCDAELNVRRVKRVIVNGEKKKSMVWVNAGSTKSKIARTPCNYDFEVFDKVVSAYKNTLLWIPREPINPDGYSAKLAQLGNKAICDTGRFLSERNAIVFADLWMRTGQIENVAIRNEVRACLTSISTVVSERQGYFGGGGGMSGKLYMPIVRMEKNIYTCLERKIKKMMDAESSKPKNHSGYIVTTQSATSMPGLPDESIDYIYIDPPFGGNIIYSEMNLMLESWLKVKTNAVHEAVIDETKAKRIKDYGALMRDSLSECYRVLKSGKWMTVEFHNSQADVWNVIQSSLAEAGFIVAQVCRLDKGSTTILEDIRPNSVVQDLLISAYKPHVKSTEFSLTNLDEKFDVWQFVQNCLVDISHRENTSEKFSERNPKILFDKLVSFCLEKGLLIPFSSGQFYKEIRKRFVEVDGLIFLQDDISSDEEESRQLIS